MALSQAEPTTASPSVLQAEDTPSWSEIDGILSDKYKSESEPPLTADLITSDPTYDSDPMIPEETAPVVQSPMTPTPMTPITQTQSTQETVIQAPLGTQSQNAGPSSPLPVYHSQPQYRERSFEEEEDVPRVSPLPTAAVAMATPPRVSPASSEASFASSQRERIARLRRELLEEEERVIARSEEMAESMRQQAANALSDPNPLPTITSMSSLRPSVGLDSSQQLSHSILDEQSRTRLKIAKPPSIASDPGNGGVNSVSVDITPLTEDLLMNSRVENGHSDGGQTISDGQFPNDDDDARFPNELDDIIFTPLSDDDFASAFVTPPRVHKKLEKKSQRPAPRRNKIKLQSQGKVIGTTELGSFDETSSLSVIDKDNVLDNPRVKPLRRHAWSDSETENSLTKSLNKQQYEDLKTNHYHPALYEEKTSSDPPFESTRPRSAFAVLSPTEVKHRPQTAPSSEKVLKFEIPRSSRYVPQSTVQINQSKPSDSSLSTNDYPHLHNSFLSLQNTIMSDIAALRREIVEKQEGTEKLRAEFSEFKHAYYKSVVEAQAQLKQEKQRLQDAKIQTSQPAATEDKENERFRRPAFVEHKDTSYSDCDSETDRQLATLKALQRSLREQSNQRYLRDLEQRLEARSAKSAASGRSSLGKVDRMQQSSPVGVSRVDRMQQSSPAPQNSRCIQTSPDPPVEQKTTVNVNCDTSDLEELKPKSSLGQYKPRDVLGLEEYRPKSSMEGYKLEGSDSSKELSPKSRTESATPMSPGLTLGTDKAARSKTPTLKIKSGAETATSTQKTEAAASTQKTDTAGPVTSANSSLDSTEQATRDLFMEILRRKAEMDTERQEQQDPHLSTKENQTSIKNGASSTPKPGRRSGKTSFTPAASCTPSDTSTVSTLVGDQDYEIAALNALWTQFMKFVVQSKALKQHKSKTGAGKTPCLQVDVKRLEKLEESFCKDTFRKSKKGSKSQEGKDNGHKSPDVFEISAGNLRKPKSNDESVQSVDSRQGRIDRLIYEIEEERLKRAEKREKQEKKEKKAPQENKKPGKKAPQENLIAAELDSFPMKDHVAAHDPKPPSPPVAQKVKSPVAFEISLDMDSVTSEEVERAPGYPNMVFKTGKLQDAFHAHKRRFIQNSRKRALCIQLCKEARQKYATSTPPERPRPTIDAKYFSAFDIPPPRMKSRFISHKDMTRHSKKIYERLEEVQKKKKESKVQRERETYRLRAKLFNKKVQDTLLNKKYIGLTSVY